MLSLPRTKLNQKAIDKLVTANWPFIRVLDISGSWLTVHDASKLTRLTELSIFVESAKALQGILTI